MAKEKVTKKKKGIKRLSGVNTETLYELFVESGSLAKVGERFGCTSEAVRQRLRWYPPYVEYQKDRRKKMESMRPSDDEIIWAYKTTNSVRKTVELLGLPQSAKSNIHRRLQKLREDE